MRLVLLPQSSCAFGARAGSVRGCCVHLQPARLQIGKKAPRMHQVQETRGTLRVGPRARTASPGTTKSLVPPRAEAKLPKSLLALYEQPPRLGQAPQNNKSKERKNKKRRAHHAFPKRNKTRAGHSPALSFLCFFFAPGSTPSEPQLLASQAGQINKQNTK